MSRIVHFLLCIRLLKFNSSIKQSEVWLGIYNEFENPFWIPAIDISVKRHLSDANRSIRV